MKFEIVEKYSTGLTKRFRIDGEEFDWVDWVLCEVSFNKQNPIHFCIASNFRDNGKTLSATLMNPSYDEMVELPDLNKLAWFKVVQVMHTESTKPSKHMPRN